MEEWGPELRHLDSSTCRSPLASRDQTRVHELLARLRLYPDDTEALRELGTTNVDAVTVSEEGLLQVLKRVEGHAAVPGSI